jgi:hypothetical protein
VGEGFAFGAAEGEPAERGNFEFWDGGFEGAGLEGAGLDPAGLEFGTLDAA